MRLCARGCFVYFIVSNSYVYFRVFPQGCQNEGCADHLGHASFGNGAHRGKATDDTVTSRGESAHKARPLRLHTSAGTSVHNPRLSNVMCVVAVTLLGNSPAEGTG